MYSYFDTVCPTNVTIPIGILGSDSLELLERGSQCFSKKKEESMNTSVCIICAVSFSQGETLELHSSYRDPGNHYPCYLSTLWRMLFNSGADLGGWGGGLWNPLN